jgi:hypothetical protein
MDPTDPNPPASPSGHEVVREMRCCPQSEPKTTTLYCIKKRSGPKRSRSRAETSLIGKESVVAEEHYACSTIIDFGKSAELQ